MVIVSNASSVSCSWSHFRRTRFDRRFPAGAPDDTLPHSRCGMLCAILSATRKLASDSFSLRAGATRVAGAWRDLLEGEADVACGHQPRLAAGLVRKRTGTARDDQRGGACACGSCIRVYEANIVNLATSPTKRTDGFGHRPRGDKRSQAIPIIALRRSLTLTDSLRSKVRMILPCDST